MRNILLVEDSKELQVQVREALRGFAEVVAVPSMSEALKETQKGGIDLILLDIVLPDGDGFRLFRYFRKQNVTKATPIIFLSGFAHKENLLEALHMGATDFVEKPFLDSELLKVVCEKLGHQAQERGFAELFRNGPYEIDLIARRAFVQAGGSRGELRLTSLEFKLLVYFMKNAGVILGRDQLYKLIWEDKVHVSLRTLDRHVSSLRQKLQNREDIQSVRGQGYIFAARSA